MRGETWGERKKRRVRVEAVSRKKRKLVVSPVCVGNTYNSGP